MWLVAGAFVLALLFGVPLAFTLCLAALTALLVAATAPEVFAQQLYSAVNSFPLLAIPFFLFAGDLLNRTGMTTKIIDFAVALFGWMRGGAAHVNIGSSILFAGISGSAIADSAAVGSMMIPAMRKEGFTAPFSAAVTATSSVIGPIIPPSVIMIVYGSSLNVSIASLFAAGILPGLLMGFALMLVVFWRGWRGEPMGPIVPFRVRHVFRSGFLAIPALMLPIIIIGGMLSGVFTATEAGAIAVAYALALSTTLRLLSLRQVLQSLVKVGLATALITFIIAASNPFGWLLSLQQVPQNIARMLTGFSSNIVILLLLINAFLFIAGMLMETTASVLILGPILAPVALGMGVDPIHFALIVIINLLIGLATPPLGLSLFVVAPLAESTVERVSRAAVPFVLAQTAVLMVVTFVPAVTLWVPSLM